MAKMGGGAAVILGGYYLMLVVALSLIVAHIIVMALGLDPTVARDVNAVVYALVIVEFIAEGITLLILVITGLLKVVWRSKAVWVVVALTLILATFNFIVAVVRAGAYASTCIADGCAVSFLTLSVTLFLILATGGAFLLAGGLLILLYWTASSKPASKTVTAIEKEAAKGSGPFGPGTAFTPDVEEAGAFVGQTAADVETGGRDEVPLGVSGTRTRMVVSGALRLVDYFGGRGAGASVMHRLRDTEE